MSTRLTWLLGLVILIAVGFLAACASHFSASSDGLVIVPSQGSAVLQAFSFNLSNGRTAQINTSPAIKPAPEASSQLPIVLDPAGAFAYVASTVTCNQPTNVNPNFSNPLLTGAVQGAITAYKVNSNGTLSANGNAVFLKGNPAYPLLDANTPPSPFPTCGLDDSTNPNGGNAPVALAIDSAGKFLFVATQFGAVTYSYTDKTNPNAPVTVTTNASLPGVVQIFSIGSNASLTEVPGSPFAIPAVPGGNLPNPLGLAVSHTVFPSVPTGNNGATSAVCSGNAPPTTENLYVTDSANNQVFEYSVDPSSGALAQVPTLTGLGVPTGQLPQGVAVDPCNRFVYVANEGSNNVSGYTVCNTPSVPNCPQPDGSLVSVGAPASAGNGPTVLAIDPFGNFVYVVDSQILGGGAISSFRISPASGALSPVNATVATGANPVAIAIRGDDQWLFVTNNGAGSVAGSVSQFSIIPSSGALSPLPAITTDSFPWGVAVK